MKLKKAQHTIKNISIPDCFIIEPTPFRDHRGIFIKPFQDILFNDLEIDFSIKEFFFTTSHINVIRGLHFQHPPVAQSKLVGCLSGQILDVVLDLRKDSPTFGKFELINLDNARFQMLFIPVGLAHGFLTLSQNSTVIYFSNERFTPEYDAGICWNSLNIPWPVVDPILSERDAQLPEFRDFVSPFSMKKQEATLLREEVS